MHCVDRLEFHQLVDRILPSRCLPEGDDRNNRAAGRGGEFGDAQQAAAELQELHVSPKPTAERADAVSDCQRAP
jgi:hypothetical protein